MKPTKFYGQKTFKECILSDPTKGQKAWDVLQRKASENLYFDTFMRELATRKLETEGTLQGDVDTETDVTTALGEVYNQIVMGVEEHQPLNFARIFTTNKTELKVHVGTHGVALQRTATGGFSAGEKTTAAVTIALDKEYGVDISWTKAHLEDAAWDVMAEQNQGAGYSIQQLLAAKLTAEIKAITAATAAGGAFVAIAATNAITWAEFLTLVGTTDIAGTGPSDYVICTPARYWQLLALDQFVNQLYAGSDEVMRSGIAKLMMGVTVVRAHSLADLTTLAYDGCAGGIDNFTPGYWVKGAGGAYGRVASVRNDVDGVSGKLNFDEPITGAFVADEVITEYTNAACSVASGVAGTEADTLSQVVSDCSICALNSKKALALAYRRNIEIEPFAYPDENRYGFIASVRAKADTIVPSAVAIGDQ